MPFAEHLAIVTPPDDTILWRYFSFFGFMELIQNTKLRFTRADKFKDPLEGTHTDAEDSALTVKYANTAIEDLPPTELFNHLAPIMNFVSCWREGDQESMAMWDLYNKGDGTVAIKSTIGLLKETLTKAEGPCFVGRVNYVPWGSHIQSDVDPYSICFRKDMSYRHEEEVRALITSPEQYGFALGQGHDKECERMSDVIERIPSGIDLVVDLPQVVTGVVVGPEEHSRNHDLVKSIVQHYRLPWNVTPSDRLRRRK